MNVRKAVIFLVVILLISFNFSQGARTHMAQPVDVSIDTAPDGEGVAYSEPIDWSHFKGTPEPASNFSAMIYCGISMKYEFVKKNGETVVDIKLRPYMNSEKSWYKDSLADTRLLVHEQGHFDIAAMVAEEFAEDIRRNHFDPISFKLEIDSLYEHYQQVLAKRQSAYDAETHHGVNAKEQLAWNERFTATVSSLAVQ